MNWRDALTRIDPHDYRFVTWLFLRGLGIIYLIAFLSLSVQIHGLIGSEGIFPLTPSLETIASRYPSYSIIWQYPTLFWFNGTDTALTIFALVGIAASIMLIINILPMFMTLILWVCYLSFVTAGQIFFGYQWDFLLLEIGFLAIFLAPLWVNPRRIATYRPPTLIIWLFRILLFRLMLAAGLVKLLSGDTTWADMTALSYHYQTQPIPNPVAWFAYQLPLWFHQFSAIMVFILEIPLPFLYFAPRKLRYIAGILTIILQVLIILTGNFAFFNWLTIILSLFLFDDAFFRRSAPQDTEPEIATPSPLLRQRITLALAVVLIPLSAISLLGQMRLVTEPPILSQLAPFGIVNHYGLFADMTIERPQLIIEGSADGTTWESYTLRYQPQQLDRTPPFVAPHQPRLDWQLWIASLGDTNTRENRWLNNLTIRLLQGSESVTALFAENPFPDDPPQYIRIQVYDYRFTDADERAETGNWWQRTYIEDYLSPASLADFGQ